MKKILMAGALAVMIAVSSYALPLGSNITIYDNQSSSGLWYGTNEDQEVEPGAATGQQWDLEAMYLSSSTLTLVGGYDFRDGQTFNSTLYTSGDIFFDVTGDVRYGTINDGSGLGGTTTDRFGYDYVIDLDYNTMTYDVYQLGPGSVLSRGLVFDEANPVTYVSGGTAVAGYQDVPFTYYENLTSADVGGWVGATHYAIVVNTAFLGSSTFTAHYTMTCGNDNLMGRGRVSVSDGGATLLLLGVALLGMRAVSRKLS